jgi:hypothetical protein
MGIKQRLARVLLSDQIDAMGQTLNLMESAYRRGPYSLSEEDLVRLRDETAQLAVDVKRRPRVHRNRPLAGCG